MAFKHLPLFLIGLSLGVAPLRADDQIQSVQQALKAQGFYYGDVDGEGGPETDAAIRRFQIRSGLEVTGKLNPETMSALHVGANAPANDDANAVQAVPKNDAPPAADEGDRQAQATPPPAVVQNDHDFLRRHPAPTPAPEAAEPPADTEQPQPPPPDDQAQPPAPEPLQAPPAAYARFFLRTPYEEAPLEVQRSTVHRAQVKLAREGMFEGVADGQPSRDLSRGIAMFQRQVELPETGRLDMETLAQLDLLPHRRQIFRDPFPSDQFDEPPARPVYRGIWVH